MVLGQFFKSNFDRSKVIDFGMRFNSEFVVLKHARG
jgi:hypothetical protein